MSNVLGFGAIGDGVADDTSALQHTLDAGDGVLRLNRGTYRITRPLILDLTKRGFGGVRGEGGTSKIVMAGPGPAIRVIGDHQGTASPRTVQPHTWEKERFPTINGVEIVGEHPESVGIELRKTMKCVVSQVLIRQCRIAVHLVERNRDFLLADSNLYDNHEIGLFLDRCNLHQIIVHGCHISWNKVAGIKSLGGDVHNLQIVGNDIEYNNLTAGGDKIPADVLDQHPGGSEILFDATDGIISEVTISGNTIQATLQDRGANIRVLGAAVQRPQPADTPPAQKADTAHLINITGNVLGSQWRAVELLNVSRVTVTGNTIYDSADLSVYGQACSGIVVTGNAFSWRGLDNEPRKDGIRFEDSDNIVVSSLTTQRLCAGSKDSGAAITFVRCSDSSVSDCQILDPLHRGVELEDCTRCRVSNNTIADRRQQPAMSQAIRVKGKGSNLVAGNILSGAVDRLLDVAEGAAEVQGNMLIS
ncbi:right-handed parallel beta-helix repeat-containing protein [Schlesneria sp. T3-172]|uniref:right-handed parallel beta-helix repeat-containing protein n=1 Tax=Schlesneria TaxID=656899 RepID=UPI002EF54115